MKEEEGDLEKIKFPMMWSPKLDGIRTMIHPNGPVTRKIKLIPNEKLRTFLDRPALQGFDGEMLYGNLTDPEIFNRTQSAVMKISGPSPQEADGQYLVFDDFSNPNTPFEERFRILAERVGNLPPDLAAHVQLVPHEIVTNRDDLMNCEGIAVDQGYEGIMGRAMDGRYKFGRSTMNEGILFKIKRFVDAEGTVIGFEEMNHNDNEKVKDALGHSKRATLKENMRPAGTLGKLILEVPGFDEPVKVGSGYTAVLKQSIWDNQVDWIGASVTIKYQASGMKDAPRFAVFKGRRHD